MPGQSAQLRIEEFGVARNQTALVDLPGSSLVVENVYLVLRQFARVYRRHLVAAVGGLADV